MKKGEEKKVQDSIIKYFKDHNIFFERRVVSGFNYKKGIPDLYCVYKGRHVEIEVKKERGGALSTLQLKWSRYFKTHNIYYILAKRDIDVINFLRLIDIELEINT